MKGDLKEYNTHLILLRIVIELEHIHMGESCEKL